MKSRLDKLLTEYGLVTTRSRAQERILAGEVSVNGSIITKPGILVDDTALLALHGNEIPYVSRGGLKLAAALTQWKIDLIGRVCLDVGISTGGFTDCMLQHGAREIIGIDTGSDQLAQKLRTDQRVRLMERTNARYLTAKMIPAGISFFTMDVSFIAASLVIPAVISAVAEANAREKENETALKDAVVLVKPQYEAGREHVGKRGIVREPAAQIASVERVRQTLLQCDATRIEVIDSPISGGDGNREYLLYAIFRE